MNSRHHRPQEHHTNFTRRSRAEQRRYRLQATSIPHPAMTFCAVNLIAGGFSDARVSTITGDILSKEGAMETMDFVREIRFTAWNENNGTVRVYIDTLISAETDPRFASDPKNKSRLMELEFTDILSDEKGPDPESLTRLVQYLVRQVFLTDETIDRKTQDRRQRDEFKSRKYTELDRQLALGSNTRSMRDLQYNTTERELSYPELEERLVKLLTYNLIEKRELLTSEQDGLQITLTPGELHVVVGKLSLRFHDKH